MTQKVIDQQMDRALQAQANKMRGQETRPYDSNALDQRLRLERGIELIAPHLRHRGNKTQEGRPARRYKHRWNVERLFAWLQNYRRLVTRWERHGENSLGFLHRGRICILKD